MRRTLLVLVLCLALVPACSDDGDSGGDSADPAAAADVEDLSEEERETVETAQAWIDDEAELDDAQKEALRFTAINVTPDVSNVTFTQYADDHPVRGAELVVHVLADGEVQGATNALTDAQPAGE